MIIRLAQQRTFPQQDPSKLLIWPGFLFSVAQHGAPQGISKHYFFMELVLVFDLAIPFNHPNTMPCFSRASWYFLRLSC
ncbi:MAG: hypothetical protein KAX57_06960 [Rhodoferax sp.]|nr:hypothetical protein [Rhodoferax sp.]